MKKTIGDRIIQILLLIIIAALGTFAVLTLKPSGDTDPSAQRPGSGIGMGGGQRPPGMAGGAPGRLGGEEEILIAVEADSAVLRDITQSIKVNGDVITDTSVDIYSDIGGVVTGKSASVGDYIRKGGIIAEVDPSIPGQVYSSSSVTATISGTITSDYAEVGDTINTQTPIATIGDLSNLLIQTYIPEKYVSVLKQGLKADVRFDAFPDEIFTASVMEISPVMNTSSRTIEIKLSFENPGAKIKAGMFARISLVTKASLGTLSIPATALFNYYDQDSVYLINDGQVKRQPVKLGLSSDQFIEVVGGLSEGDKVVTHGLNNLTDGSKIRTVSTGE